MSPLAPGFARDHRDEMVEGLKALKKGLEEPDFTVLFHTCNSIATVRWRSSQHSPGLGRVVELWSRSILEPPPF